MKCDIFVALFTKVIYQLWLQMSLVQHKYATVKTDFNVPFECTVEKKNKTLELKLIGKHFIWKELNHKIIMIREAWFLIYSPIHPLVPRDERKKKKNAHQVKSDDPNHKFHDKLLIYCLTYTSSIYSYRLNLCKTDVTAYCYEIYIFKPDYMTSLGDYLSYDWAVHAPHHPMTRSQFVDILSKFYGNRPIRIFSLLKIYVHLCNQLTYNCPRWLSLLFQPKKKKKY